MSCSLCPATCANQRQCSAQLAGIAFGLAIGGAIFLNTAIDGLSGILPDVARSELQLAISGTSGTFFQSLPDDLRLRSTEVIVGALREVFVPVYVGAAVSLLVSVCFTVCSCLSGLDVRALTGLATQVVQGRHRDGDVIRQPNEGTLWNSR